MPPAPTAAPLGCPLTATLIGAFAPRGRDGTAWPMGLNDANAVFQHGGTWHIMHQCDGGSVGGPCGGGHEGPLPSPVPGEQTYWHSWGHVVSTDGARWKRVADALTPTVHGVDHDHGSEGDGAVSFPDGKPVLLYSSGAGFDFPKGLTLVTGLARPADPTDPELVRWDKHTPLTWENGTAPCALAGRIWRSGGKYHMVCVTTGLTPPWTHKVPDARYETTNSSLEGPWRMADPRFACPGPAKCKCRPRFLWSSSSCFSAAAQTRVVCAARAGRRCFCRLRRRRTASPRTS